MVAPRFYIFGVPDGFDMLGGTRQEISYFQRFYDGSTEDTKFTSHRDSNGNVTYTFLKYNLSSGKSRTGSFFGMSLAFSGVYCNHPLRLYELFDYVYHNHILCNTSDASKGILKPIANSDIKAQYLITRFEDCKEYINFVEKVFQHNLATDGMLTNSFYPLDPAFKNENQNLVVKLPLVVELEDEEQRKQYRERFEESLIGRFREYSYVTISPDWKLQVNDKTKKPDPDVEIAPQEIVRWKDLIPDYQRYIIQGLGNLAEIDNTEALRYQKQAEVILNQLKKYSYNKNIAPSIQADYEELCNQLADLYSKAKPTVTVSASPANGGTVTGGGIYEQGFLCTVTALANKGFSFINWIEDGNVVSNNANYTFNVTGNRTLVANFTGGGGVAIGRRIKEWVAENKSKVAGIIGAAVVVVLLALVLPRLKSSDDPKTNPEPSYCEQAKDSIRNKLDVGIYAEAKAIAERIPDLSCREAELNLVKKEQANSLNVEIDNLKNNKKWKDAFEKANEYYDEDTKNTKLDEIQSACVNDFTTRIYEVKESNYSAKSPSLKRELSAVKDYIGNENYNTLITELDMNKPKEEPKPKTSTYVVEFYKTDVSYIPQSETPTQTFSSNGNMNVGSDHYIYKIKKDGKYLIDRELKNTVGCSNGEMNVLPKEGVKDNLRIYLSTSSGGNLTIGSFTITITKQ